MKNNSIPILLYPGYKELRSPDCDCDCACENSLQMQVFEPLLKGEWVATEQVYPILHMNEWTTLYNPLGPMAVSVVNEAGLILWKSFKAARRMEELDTTDLGTAKTMASVGLLRAKLPLKSFGIETTKTLSAWLHLTNACNLRCRYCYLQKTTENMSQEIGFLALKTVFNAAQKHNYQSVKIKYAGGEPFITFDLLRQMHFEAKRLTGNYQMNLEEVIISNGTLIKASHIEFLQEENIRLSISLDGIGTANDQQRPHVDGRGSFSEIERSLLLCKRKNYYPDVTITVTDGNVDQLEEITRYLLDKGLHFNFNFYRENDCSVSFQDLKFSSERMIAGIKKAYRVIEQSLPDWSLLGALADRSSFTTPHTHTCSVGQHYMVIDHHGQISKCQMTMGIPITNLYSNDPLLDIRNDNVGIQNLSVEEKEGCKTCEWKNWCTGGCSLATYRATGRYDVKSPNCNIYKAIYPELLRLESLRLIKYADLRTNQYHGMGS